MKRVVLDTNVLLSEPVILAKRAEGVELIVPATVLDEAGIGSRGGRLGGLADLISRASQDGSVRIVPSPAVLSQSPIGDKRSGIGDTLILETALGLKNEEETLYLATRDRGLAKAAREQGIETLGVEDLLSLLDSAQPQPQSQTQPQTDSELLEYAQRLKRSAWVGPLISGLVGVATSKLLDFLYSNPALVREGLGYGFVLFVLPLVGVLLFWIRSKFRLVYGVSEFATGVMTAVRATGIEISSVSIDAVTLLQVLGGLYIMVRGLENIGKGLRGTRFQFNWERVFGSP